MTYGCTGIEWIVDAEGCDARSLRSRALLEEVCAEIVRATGLTPLGPGSWHVFGGEAGVTGLQMLSESHLACHTYPEAGYAAFSLYSCRPMQEPWPWNERLAVVLGATRVTIRTVRRGPAEGETVDEG
jgi:S-adenosylmethionine decarboxylase